MHILFCLVKVPLSSLLPCGKTSFATIYIFIPYSWSVNVPVFKFSFEQVIRSAWFPQQIRSLKHVHFCICMKVIILCFTENYLLIRPERKSWLERRQLNGHSEKWKDTRSKICTWDQGRKKFWEEGSSHITAGYLANRKSLEVSVAFGNQITTGISARVFSQSSGIIKCNAECWGINKMWERKAVKGDVLFLTLFSFESYSSRTENMINALCQKINNP